MSSGPSSEKKWKKKSLQVIRNIEHDKTLMTLILATIGLAKQLDKKVVLEGVEKENQSKRLFSHGSDLQQSYFFSRPIPEEELVEFFHSFSFNE